MSSNAGRLPEALLGRFACEHFAVPPARHEHLLRRFERRFHCHLVTYRAGCPAPGGPSHLCSNAYAASLSVEAKEALKTLEATLQNVILVAYERPWRFRSREAAEAQLPQGHEAR